MEFIPAGTFFSACTKHGKQLPQGIVNRFFNSPVPGRQLILTMKLTVVLITVFLLQAHAGSYSQTVTFSGKNIPLEKVFAVIEKQTGYVFFFNYNILDKAKPVDLKVKNASLSQVLKDCFEGQPLEYDIEDKTISVKKKEGLLGSIASLLGGEKPGDLFDISGIVTTMDGAPLSGAYIFIKGTSKGVTTDEKGRFTIKEIPKKTILVASFTGYKTQEVTVGNDLSISIKLPVSTSQLDEVETIGYGTTTRRFSVGSQSKISAEEIASQPVTNFVQALEGRIPGVVVSQTSGLPGTMVNIQVRGQNTLSTSPGTSAYDQPLFIIDGVPFAPQNNNVGMFLSLASYGSGGASGNGPSGISALNSINPADIENIEILRDADATSIYGSRGANGVVLITTKKGKAGKTRFNANVNTGASMVTRTMPLMNTQQYLTMRREAFKNDGANPAIANAPDLLVYDTTSYTDWKKYFFGTAHTTDANASVTGGTANTTFYLGAGYHFENYVIPGAHGDSRISINTGFHHSSTDQKFSLDFSTNYSYDRNNSTAATELSSIWGTLAPDYPTAATREKGDGTLVWTYNGYSINNVQSYARQTYLSQHYNLTSHLQVGYRVLPGLTVNMSIGYNAFSANDIAKIPSSSHPPGSGSLTLGRFGEMDARSWIAEPQAEFKKKLGPGKLEILAGGTLQANTNSSLAATGAGYANDALLGSLLGASSVTVNNDFSQYKYEAVFGRVNYIWRDEYIVNFTGRRDGSSRFGPGKQFGNFSSVGTGWIFSQEDFFKQQLPFLSHGKLRASYGTTGSDAIGDYQYLSLWQPYPYSFQGSPAYAAQNLFNADYSWSVTKKLETGLELGFLKDRIFVNLAWYRNRCGNQLTNYPLPIQTGFSSIVANSPAVVQNTGFEFQFNVMAIKTKAFTWSTNANLSIPRNKLVAFPNIQNSPYNAAYIIGQSTSIVKGYRFAGVNDTTGVYQFLSAKGIPVYRTGADYSNIIADITPRFIGGWKNTFTWKAFQVDIFLDFKKQTGKNYLGQIGIPGQALNMPVTVLDRWQKPGDHSAFQRFTQNAGSDASQALTLFNSSSVTYSDASFIRVRTVSFSYNFPTSTLKRTGIQGLRLYLNIQNLFTITGYKGNDPEMRNWLGIPLLKTAVAGLQCNF